MKTIKTLAMIFAAVAMIATSCTPADNGGESVKTDLTELNAAIAACDEALADADGKYPADAITTLQTLVTTAKSAVATNLSQTAADNLTQQLTAALEVFQGSKLDAIPADALTFALSFDEGQGTSLTTTGKYEWTAVLTAGPAEEIATPELPTFVDGKKGKAMHFDNGAHLEISNYAANVLEGNELSIAAWVNPEEARPGNYIISYNYWNTWKLNIQDGGKPFFTVGTTAGITDMDNETDQSVPANAWTHVVVTCNTTVGTVCFYVNGYLTKEWNAEARPNLVGTVTPNSKELPIMIGACTTYEEALTWDWFTPASGGWNDWFKGSIDELQVYNKALTAGQVAALYNE